VSISKKIKPSAYKSLRPSTGSARACSGERYSGVPMITPLTVMPVEPAERATPKSVMRASPSSLISTFAGFRSRCTTPR
jgi:hypothetical protein